MARFCVFFVVCLFYVSYVSAQGKAAKKPGKTTKTEVSAGPYIKYCGKTGGSLTKSDAQSGSGIVVSSDKAGKQAVFVISFEVSVPGIGSSVSHGAYFSSAQKKIISKIKTGSKLIFSSIKIRNATGNIVELKKGISFIIK